MTSSNNSLYCQLFEETVELAIEEGKHTSSKECVCFVNDMLPPEVIIYLEDIFTDGSTFLEDFWSQKFESTTTDDTMEDTIEDQHICQICERDVTLTRHHLYPKEVHRRCLKRGVSEKDIWNVVHICRMCHSTIHRFYSNDELSKMFYTLELLLEDNKIQKYRHWASAQSSVKSKTR